jgi:hypothetical protein
LKPLTQVATPEDDARLAREAPACSTNHLEGLAREKRRVTREQAASDHRSRRLRWWWRDRMLHLEGQLPDTDGALVEKALRRLADKASPGPEGTYDPFDARCADALVQMASSKLGTDNDTDRTTVVIHAHRGSLPRIEEGPVISGETFERVLCATRFQVVEEDAGGRVVSGGKVRRTAPPWQRRVLLERDRHCRFPGCASTYWLHPHHIVHFVDGGETTTENQVLLCGRHHRFLHEHGWKVEGDPGSVLRFLSPDGRIFESGIPTRPSDSSEAGTGPPGDASSSGEPARRPRRSSGRSP